MSRSSTLNRTATPIITSAAIAIILLLGGCRSIGQYGAYHATGSAMCPLISPGDGIFADESKNARSDLHDGDVVVFRHNDTVLIKRILATQGETISGDHGKIIRNGKQVDEPYLAPTKGDESAEYSTFQARVVPAGEIFVMGDNRDLSLDSRFTEFGPVHASDVVGKYAWTYLHAKAAAK